MPAVGQGGCAPRIEHARELSGKEECRILQVGMHMRPEQFQALFRKAFGPRLAGAAVSLRWGSKVGKVRYAQ